MKKISITVFAVMLYAACFAKDTIPTDFKIVKKQGAITLYERWLPGSKGEPVRELKAEFLVESDIQNVIRLLTNQSAGMKWNQNASVYRIAHTLNDDEWINYIRYNMPLMFDDQDCCLLYKISASSLLNKNKCVINFESINSPLFPSNPDLTRITGVNGQWKLEQQPNHLLKITYLISSDKSGSIPRFISDPIIHNNLFKTMESFKNLLEK